MAAQLITKVVVKNLPEQWTVDYLRNFLEVFTYLTIADNGIQLFRGITHTALLTLEEPVTEESLSQGKQNLAQTPFEGMTLQLEAITCGTCSILVSYTDPILTHDHVLYYFDNPTRSGCGNAEVTECDMHPEIRLAVVHFSLPEGVTGVIAKGKHTLKQGEEVLRVEPWYEQFHRPLLQQLILRSKRKGKSPPPVPRKPKFSQGPSTLVPPSASSGPSRPQEESDVEKLKREMHILKQKNLKAEEEAREMERLKSENEKLKKQASIELPVFSHQLRLLADFVSTSREGCKVILMEREEKVLFHGVDESCQEARQEFLLRLQELTDDYIRLSAPIFKILETARGKVYVEDMVQRYLGCAIKVHNSQLSCAAISGANLQGFKEEFERNVICKTCKVPPTLTCTPQFQHLKFQLEQEYMVTLTLPSAVSSEDVQLDGLNGDVELAAREVDKYTNSNRSNSKQFHIPGRLQGQACKKWHSRELDEVKQLILKNGEIEGESEEDGYTLTFQCRQETLPMVLKKLTAIKEGIAVVKVDLNKEFPKYAERALLINGLHSRGAGSFCSHLAEKLKEFGLQSIGDFRLPDICRIPELRFKRKKANGGSGKKVEHRRRRFHDAFLGGHSDHHRGQHHSSKHHRSYPALPCSVSVDGVTITIKSGDITAEQVGAAVCVVGQDLDLRGTNIGAGFLRKCPSLAQVLSCNGSGGVEEKECRLVTTPTSGGNLPMPFVFHAVLTKLHRNAVQKVVADVVKQSLQLTVQNGQTSIAFPPIGVGRRFNFGEYTTASSMAFAFKGFLEANPNSVQNITVVVKEGSLAGKFAQIITQKLGTSAPAAAPAPAAAAAAPAAATAAAPAPPPQPPTVDDEENSSDSDADDDNNDDIVLEEQEVPDAASGFPKEAFEAQICTASAEDNKIVIDILLQELGISFLWHETLRKEELDTFFRLDELTLQEICRMASEKSVHLSMSEKGLQMCGQKHCVHELRAEIQDKRLQHIKQQHSKVWDKRSRLGLPVDTDHLPSYWKVCRKEKDHKVNYDKAFTAWQKRGVKLNSVTPQEQAEVDKVIQATWEQGKAGQGKDARDLSHTKIQVIKVERLENPQLWHEYSHKREQLFLRLEHRYPDATSPVQFTPVDKLKGSKQAIRTSANIPPGSLLCREIYPQINEHYLFHGTKKSVLKKIFTQGLDFRVARKAMLGSGVYAAESSTKADQYTDFKEDRTHDEELTMFLMRVLLGEPFIHKNDKPLQFSRPPCLNCSQSRCDCVNSDLFNSVIDDSTRIFREFVVYDQSVCYPEYVVTYKRV